ncbi:PDZ domain (Also known as DHR or GLGF) [Zhouia amylolytica]|uniref:PDZ domain (Also known as DHR or GLGF) n=1 Tax=Zhouia amylolytica TaxID=376730 RepID=A0A1I6RKA0_9FLAO|nr:aspartyl protease family protein [Zhouia amylolytica]SFS65112.1 PDZ domain (Also known as DHR or GLGF) [Zhouia amylolytica]
MKHIFWIFLLGMQCALGQTSGTAPWRQTLNAFEKGFKLKSFNEIKPLLSAEFSIGVYQNPTTDPMLKSIVENYFQLDSLQLISDTLSDGLYKVKAKYFFKGQKDYASYIVFDKDGKIQYTDLFDQLYKVNRYEKSELVAKVPFEIINGAIAVKARFNDSSEEFTMLFDTGADGIALSEAMADKVSIKNVVDRSTSVVGASAKVKYSSGNTMQLGEVSIDRQNLVVFPTIRKGFDGLFGGNLLSRFITKVNFDTGHIELYSLGEFKGEGTPLKIDYSGMLPVISTDVSLANGKAISGEYVFDTGAGYNIISFGPFSHQHGLYQEVKADYYSTNFSFGHQSRIKLGSFSKIALGTYTFNNVQGAVQEYDETNKEWASHDGSVGFEIIRRFNFTIDVLHNLIYLEPNQGYHQPFGFTISGVNILFKDEEMVVNSVVRGSKAERQGIKSGALVHTINGNSAAELMEADKMNALKNSESNPVTFNITQDDNSKQITL